MSRADRFERKLDELRSAAEQAALRWAGREGLQLDVPEEGGDWYARFQRSVDELTQRFQRFFPLDPVPFEQMSMSLGGGSVMDSRLGEQGPVPDVDPRTRATAGLPSASRTAFHLIDSAYGDWIQWVDGLIRAGDWESPAATQFAMAFLGPVHDAVRWQQAYVAVLALAVRVYYAAADRAWDDLEGIADACISALQADGTSGFSFTGFMNLLSTVTAVVGLAMSSGLAIPISAVGLASGLLATFGTPGEPIPYQIGPYQPDEPPTIVIEQTWDAITRLEQALDDIDARLAHALREDLNDPQALGSPKLELPRVRDLPDIPTTFDDLNDGLVTAPGVPISDSVVVRSVVDLYRAGHVMLPGAAVQYDLAIQQIESCTIDYWAGRFFPQSNPEFGAARNNLLRILRHTRDDLQDAGQELTQAALSYQLTDDEHAERLRQIDQIMPPTGHERLTDTQTYGRG